MPTSSKTGRKSTTKSRPQSAAPKRVPGAGNNRQNSGEKNAAPSQWGRRMARLVGEKFGVNMVENHARNEGVYRKKDVVIKCAKSIMPPVSVLNDVLDRVDELWAVYVMPEGHAEIWAITDAQVRKHAYFTHGPNVQKRAEIYLRHIIPLGKKVGELTQREVESCHIP
jgi:hypothetical protein